MVIVCDGILFDMDGTLVDSRQIVERMWLLWAAEHGLSPEAVLAFAHGRRTYDTMQLVAPAIATPDEAARLDALEAEQVEGSTAIPGAAALLAALPPDRWAVVTSAGRQLALSRLASVGLPRPRVLVAAEDVGVGKPAPDGYLLAAGQLRIRPERSVVLEDTAAGVEAGLSAGSVVIGMRTTCPNLDHCAVLVSDLTAVRVTRSVGGSLRLVIEGRGELR
jgi:sugar-phosphatase